jgi:hypothetical protein
VSRVEVEVKWVGREERAGLNAEFAEKKRLLEARSLEKFARKAHSQEWLCYKA